METKGKNKDNSLLEYKVDELQKGQTRMETKVDILTDGFNKLSVVAPHEFDAFRNYVEVTFIKKESVKGFKAVGWAVVTTFAVAIAFGLAHLLGAKV